MQQRQLRLGDILDDYCPRERRVTNHAIVAMIGQEIRQTRCTTCDAEHEYKHAKVPRPRKKDEPAGLQGQVLAGLAKRVANDTLEPASTEPAAESPAALPPTESDVPAAPATIAVQGTEATGTPEPGTAEHAEHDANDEQVEEGPVHRPLIRATLPKHEGQVPPGRPAPEFTIRQPGGGRPGRFRGRNQRGGPMFQGNRPGNPMGGGPGRGPGSRPQGGRGPHNSVTRQARRHDGGGRKRSK